MKNDTYFNGIKCSICFKNKNKNDTYPEMEGLHDGGFCCRGNVRKFSNTQEKYWGANFNLGCYCIPWVFLVLECCYPVDEEHQRRRKLGKGAFGSGSNQIIRFHREAEPAGEQTSPSVALILACSPNVLSVFELLIYSKHLGCLKLETNQSRD